jgi:N-methylhydantoinase B/oxoprolinase/acetone carboxylase alpha subunit
LTLPYIYIFSLVQRHPPPNWSTITAIIDMINHHLYSHQYMHLAAKQMRLALDIKTYALIQTNKHISYSGDLEAELAAVASRIDEIEETFYEVGMAVVIEETKQVKQDGSIKK